MHPIAKLLELYIYYVNEIIEEDKDFNEFQQELNEEHLLNGEYEKIEEIEEIKPFYYILLHEVRAYKIDYFTYEEKINKYKINPITKILKQFIDEYSLFYNKDNNYENYVPFNDFVFFKIN